MSKANDKAITTNDATMNKKVEEHIISNTEKYENYKEQFQRLKKAMDNKFYLEAIFIEYAIMEDRTEAILAYEGNNLNKNGERLKKLYLKCERIVKLIRNDPTRIGTYFSKTLMDDIMTWAKERNDVTHKLLNMRITTDKLLDTAVRGDELCKELRNKANNYKRMLERRNAKQEN